MSYRPIVPFFLGACASLMLAGDAGAGSAASTAQAQRRCFCVQPTSNAYQPYKISKLTSAECSGVDYQPQPGRTGPWNSILDCEGLKDCVKTGERCKAGALDAAKKLKQANAQFARCSDDACKRKWEQAVQRLTADLAAFSKKCEKADNACYKAPLAKGGGVQWGGGRSGGGGFGGPW